MPSAEYQREWARKNPDKVKAAQKRHREKHAERIAERDKKKREDNLEEYKTKERAYYHRRKAEDPEKILEQARFFRLRRTYGITKEQYDAMVTAQGNRCACCGTDNPGSRYKNWHVDHCHTSLKIRGLLCHHCNVVAGMAKENPETLQQVADYLRTHKDC